MLLLLEIPDTDIAALLLMTVRLLATGLVALIFM
jgi:hypothetical protein